MPFFLEYPPPKGFHFWNIIARILFSIHSRSLLSRRNLLYKKSIRRRQSNSQRNSRDLSYLFLLNVPNIRKKKERKNTTGVEVTLQDKLFANFSTFVSIFHAWSRVTINYTVLSRKNLFIVEHDAHIIYVFVYNVHTIIDLYNRYLV